MSIEVLQDRVGSIVLCWPVITPCLIISAIVCVIFRRRRWFAPLWCFLCGPVLVLSACLIYLMYRTSGGSGPDWGFVVMGTMFTLALSLYEIIPGIVLLLIFPPRSAWNVKMAVPCILAAALSIGLCVVGVPYLPRHL